MTDYRELEISKFVERDYITGYTRMEEITHIRETCLYLSDLESARNFYNGILNFPVIHHDPEKHIFFRVGNSVLLCFNPADSQKKISPPPHFAYGNQHVAFEVKKTDYETVKQKIIQAGIEIIDRQEWSTGQESFYFRDPSMNILEIVPEGIWN